MVDWLITADSFSVLANTIVLLQCYGGRGEGSQDCSEARSGEQPPVPGLGAAALARLWKLPPRLHAPSWKRIAEQGAAFLPF